MVSITISIQLAEGLALLCSLRCPCWVESLRPQCGGQTKHLSDTVLSLSRHVEFVSRSFALSPLANSVLKVLETAPAQSHPRSIRCALLKLPEVSAPQVPPEQVLPQALQVSPEDLAEA